MSSLAAVEPLPPADRIESLASALASEHRAGGIGKKQAGDLLSRLDVTQRQLVACYHSTVEAAEAGRWISPAGEWLVDNFHVVREQLREGREDLPRGFYRELPQLATGRFAGLPRAFAIAVELIEHTDGLLDIAGLRHFLEAYQSVTPLTTGELWAIPIALRHAFLDRLAKIAVRVDRARREREAAARLAAELSAIAARGPKEVARALERRVAKRVDPMTTPFAAELLLRLRDQDPALAEAAAWVERRIREQGTTLDEAVRSEHQSQAANQVSVGNAITSMRIITATDWSELFEQLSLVERLLAKDPSGHYLRMDFATRDRYRHSVERIAKRARVAEEKVAEAALSLAAGKRDARHKHVGYYLIDRGLPALEKAAGCRPKLLERAHRAALRHPTPIYLSGIFLTTLALAALFFLWVRLLGLGQTAGMLVTLLALLPFSELAVSLVNLAVTALFPPRLLPKLDFLDGIAADCRTFVVVPAMLTHADGIAGLLEDLEVRFFANQDPQLHYALLSDFADAPTESTTRDDQLLDLARQGIERLNAKHGRDRFHLFHRKRVWCPSEGVFMGWERKRGKLVELNRLLLGVGESGFSVVVGDEQAQKGVKYVITLDADTRLPRDAACRLVGTMAHPLNRPRLSRATNMVVEGYAILQPRVSVALDSARRSRFARIFSDQSGIDPYTSAVSDVYQDLFQEGSFVGKGIYDLAAFDAALGSRVPERALLSHDLFEGLFARSGLVSDVELFDDAPSRYLTHSARRHRWIRGDWQLIPWLFSKVPNDEGALTPNPLSLVARWKIVDNLRRSLVSPALLLLLIAGWSVAPGPLSWTATVLLLIAFPVFAHWLSSIFFAPNQMSGWSMLRRLGGETAANLLRSGVGLLFLPHEAAVSIDAIVRASYRRCFSKRRLLEWIPAAQAERNAVGNVKQAAHVMWPSLLLAAAAGACAIVVSRGRAVVDAPLIFGWLLAPLIAVWLSRPPKARIQDASAVERHFLRRIARLTWRYFDELVTVADHHLPPDNFQEDPVPLVAHRTSPTNIGLALLANVTALDLGYLGLCSCVERLELTLATVERLDRHRGHLYNWYDTSSLQPLLPRYVSTVDSGNLAAMLIAVKQACLQATTRSPFGPEIFRGLTDTLRLLQEALDADRGLQRLQSHTMEILPLLEPSSQPTAARLRELREHAHALATALSEIEAPPPTEALAWAKALTAQLDSHLDDAVLSDPGAQAALDSRLSALADRAGKLVEQMDFKFLFQPERKVFSIGYDVQGGRLDGSFYDLLASEARLGSFVAIAKGDVPAAHWYRLARPFVQLGFAAGFERALLSWTGSMFEYLMPALLLREYSGTLLDETCRAVVEKQIAYGHEQRVPWGISECAYNARDLQLNYQYGPFGIPGLGIKRGLGEDLVVAPYATALALSVSPHAAADNLWRLSADGLEGRYGFYESIDYTPARVPDGKRGQIVRAFMAHHQAMSLLAIGEFLDHRRMAERFHAEPMIKATELLLQERVPRDAPVETPDEKEPHHSWRARAPVREPWHAFSPDADPAVHLLSNGSYSVMITEAGGGYSRHRDMAVTRYREDPTSDRYGQFHYLRDVRSGRVWSPTYQPTLTRARTHDICFSVDKAEFRRSDNGIESHTVVSVSMEDDAEVRAITLTNRTEALREIDVTSYAEVVLAPPAADAAHPAFNNLFIETEYLAAQGALLATRRCRAAHEPPIWALHVCAVDTVGGEAIGPLEHETDRVQFLHRGHNPRDPGAMRKDQRLSGGVGAVLDPIFSLRRRLQLPPGKSARVLFTTAVADSREHALALAAKYGDVASGDRISALAWTHAQAQMHYLAISVDEAHLFLRLAAKLLYSNRALRARPDVIAQNDRGQSGLWAYGISGDMPILLVRLNNEGHLDLFREALRAHEFWRLRGFSADLVILNEHPPSYLQSFQDQLLGIVRSGAGAALIDKPGGVFVRRADLMPSEDQRLLFTAARAILVGGRGNLSEQLDHQPAPRPRSAAAPKRHVSSGNCGTPMPESLQLYNGTGGFTNNEYVIHLEADTATPAPWSNVIANPRFGTLLTESGGGYDWAENSHENRLTEWSNDIVSDPLSTIFYIRDDETGAYFTPTIRPVPGGGARTIRHGQGYSVFSALVNDIEAELLFFVPVEQPLKVGRLKLRNRGGARRKLSVFPYIEWTLGVERQHAAPHVTTWIDDATGCLFAKSSMPGELGARVAFVDSQPRHRSLTADRAEFLGTNGDAAHPAALGRDRLGGRVGAGWDPCAAMQIEVVLEAGEEKEIVVSLGQAADSGEARSLVTHFRGEHAVDDAFEAARAKWDELLGAITVQTPEASHDLLVNRWLLYQATSCRLWGRTGFYQSGGAYGFRDQLQDVAALVYSQPRLAREHLLRAAARQFPEGDVQHWWHPPLGRGVRTRFSDDYLWLPYIAAHYVDTTGDAAILDQRVPFIEARALEAVETEAYLLPTRSDEEASLFEHCTRAVDRALVTGPHGLPLIGCGDWNDGMNRVGVAGRGESVWLAWFLITILNKVAPLCDKRGDAQRAERYRQHAAALKAAVEEHAWDGKWYLRAFFDDGTPLGSEKSEECQIDSIAQSWSVISGAGDPERCRQALASVDDRLFDREAGLLKLLAPPFDHSSVDPGYIKGYVPGVRENGGQYNHAAAWAVLARLLRGDGDRAGELLEALDPIRRSSRDPARYQVEPYVVAADIASVPPLCGRGGWTWYTGSASWLYRVIVESQLGFQLHGNRLSIEPCIPRAWPGFSLSYRRGRSSWRIEVKNPRGVCRGVAETTVDGQRQATNVISLDDDGGVHEVVVTLGEK